MPTHVPRSTFLRSGITGALLVLAFTGCGVSDDPTGAETPTIAVALNPAAVSIEQGSSAEVAVTVTGSGGFGGGATVALQSPPEGVTGTASDVQTSAGNTTATVTITVGAAVAPGSYNLSIRATGSGVNAATETFALTVTAAPAYEISATPAALSVEQGASATTDVALVRTNFSEAVDLALQGAPEGVAGTFSEDPTAGAASVLTIDVAESVVPGTYALTVLGTSSLADRTATVSLQVTEVGASGGFTLAEAEGLTIAQGASAVRSVGIERTGGFVGPVTVTVTDLPSGMTASVDPVTTDLGATEVTLTVGGSVASGSYTATVRGNADGFPEATTTLDITVTPAVTGGAYTLDFSMCVFEERPLWFAVQDGGGSWTPVTGVGDAYSFDVSSGTAGVALVLPGRSPGVTETMVFYTTPGEIEEIQVGDLCTRELGPTDFLDTSFAGIAAGEMGNATMGGISQFYIPAGDPSYISFQGVPDGTIDLVAYKAGLAETNPRMIISRDVTRPGGLPAPFDFYGAEGFDPVLGSISTSAVGDAISVEVGYATSPSPGVCHYGRLTAGLAISPSFGITSVDAPGVPTSLQEAGDAHVVTLILPDGFSLGTVSESFTTMGDRSIASPTAIGTPALTDITGSSAYRRVRAELMLPGGYNGPASIAILGNAGNQTFVVSGTPGWLGGLDVTLETPDFSSLAGWDNDWAPPVGNVAEWAFIANGSSGDRCTDGARSFSWTHQGPLP